MSNSERAQKRNIKMFTWWKASDLVESRAQEFAFLTNSQGDAAVTVPVTTIIILYSQ